MCGPVYRPRATKVGVALDEPDAARRLKGWSCTLYDKRWGCVVTFVSAFLKLLPLLKRVWSLQRWYANVDGAAKAREDDHGASFDAEAFTESLQSPKFALSLHVIVSLQGAVQELADWSEACPCHEAWFRSVHASSRAVYLEKCTGLPGTKSCIFMGPPLNSLKRSAAACTRRGGEVREWAEEGWLLCIPSVGRIALSLLHEAKCDLCFCLPYEIDKLVHLGGNMFSHGGLEPVAFSC